MGTALCSCLYLGDIYPSGFLPLRCGNVRSDSLVDVYRNSHTFRALHSPTQFDGKCGNCEYTHICGGSRARAFAHTGNARGAEPFVRRPTLPCQRVVNENDAIAKDQPSTLLKRSGAVEAEHVTYFRSL